MPSPADRIESLAASLPRRRPRADLAAVEQLAARMSLSPPPRAVAVVGTNGKTSTATFLARLLEAGGVKTGLTISPHLRNWSERVLVGGAELGEGELADRLEALGALSEGLDVRFFDLVTLAAAQVFVAAGVDVAIFEAGIGGRLDATRVLRPELVVLTGIGLDHAELLGADERSILREKLGVASPGALVVSAPLGPMLDGDARRWAVEAGVRLEPVVVEGATFLERNASLARGAAERLGVTPGTDGLGGVAGRAHRLTIDGVEVILDAAHNGQAWAALAFELPPSYVAVVSVSRDKRADTLAPALAGAAAVIATVAWPGRSLAAVELAGIVGGRAVDDPRAAMRLGLVTARELGLPLAVFGSSYLLRHALDELGL